MFTGITEHVGKIEEFHHGETGGRLRVNLEGSPSIAAEMKLGDSISVNGCCLTVVEFDARSFAADLSGETLRRTAFEEKKNGQPVNLERPLAATARLGGHFVQGHVDGIGRVTRLTPEGDNWWLSVRVPQDLRRYVTEKGSIAFDGISLTVARWHLRDGVVGRHGVDVCVLVREGDDSDVGDAVNVEVDILAKYVGSLIASQKDRATSHLTVAELIEEGF